MAAKYDEEMRDPEFEAAFNEDAPGASSATPAASTGGDSGGMNLPEAGEGSPAEESADAAETGGADADGDEGTPAAVVIIAEGDDSAAGAPADAGAESSANQAAAADAKAVNDQANADAANNKSAATTTGEQEAGKEAAAADKGATTAPEGSAAEEAAETPSQEAAEVAAGEGDAAAAGDKKAPMSEQQLRSWEGRLKKMEADLRAKATAAGDPPQDGAADAIEQVATEAKAEGNQDMAAAAKDVAAQVDAGEISPEDAMRQLAEDFGEPFVKMIQAIAKSTAGTAANEAVGDRLGKLEQNTQEVIDHLTNSAQRSHYQQIFDAHPDFQEVGEEPGFKEFVASTGQQAIVDGGSAAEINKLLDDYKATKQEPAAAEQKAAAEAGTNPGQDAVAAASKAQPDAVDPHAVDAAEGVRSAGLRLPDKPVKADDDFASAWEKF